MPTITFCGQAADVFVRFTMKFTHNLTAEQVASINNRKIVLLDLSIWNILSDGKTPKSREVRELLLYKCKEGKIFCPITAPTVWESRKQAGESFYRTARLMEELSLNISFRSIDQIFTNEIDSFLQFLIEGTYHPLCNNKLFGPFLSYLSPSYRIYFESNKLSKDQQEMACMISQEIDKLPLTQFMGMIGENSSPKVSSKLKYQDANIERRNFTKGGKPKMKRVETEHVARSIVIPKLNKQRAKLSIATQLNIVEKVQNLPKSKKYGSAIEYILPYLPIISAYINVNTISGYDINRKDSENDFYDREIMIYGLSYPSIFAAADKWIKHLMHVAHEEGDIGALCFAGDLQELEAKLT